MEIHLTQEKYLKEIQHYLTNFLKTEYPDPYSGIGQAFSYHLGLDDPLSRQGKRIRPILTLISAAGAGADETHSLPAACAIELIHNFSLIHDDIEDGGLQRRGKPALWQTEGLAQGLNLGDAMFNAAFLTLDNLSEFFPRDIVNEAYQLLFATCSALTKGQYLDIRFETEESVSTEQYFEMIKGKTAALIACSTEMGALLGGLQGDERDQFRQFGFNLGVAFQIYDDWLGIWGKEELTGKSAVGDILDRKKTYPILMGLEESKVFREIFLQKVMTPDLARRCAEVLTENNVSDRVQAECELWTGRAMSILETMQCKPQQTDMLKEIADKLLMRIR